MALFELVNPVGQEQNPNYKGAKITKPIGNGGLVNVVKDYWWTLTPKNDGARGDTPYISIIERKLLNDVMLQQLAYNITAATKAGAGVPEDVNKILSKYTENTDTASSVSSDIPKQSNTETSSTNPYEGLYNLKDTGWSFIFPYFDTQNHNINSSWGEPASTTALGGIINEVSGAITGAATDLNRLTSALGVITKTNEETVKPGTYIERAKQYQYNASGASYSASFILYNTIEAKEIIKNWELCFLLMYNILPNRKSKTIFDPPPLYEVTIPGVRKSPVSFIKGLKVDFVGATRIMKLDVAGQKEVRTIVPDAYSIRIDFEDVLPESKNFMNAMLEDESRISVSKNTPKRSESDLVSTELNPITHISL